MIRADWLGAIKRYLAVFVAVAVQLVAVAVIGDMVAVTPGVDAGLPPPSETIARVAPAARGDRLMTRDLSLDLIPVTVPTANTEPTTETTAGVVPEPRPQPRIDPTTSAATQQAELRMLALMNVSRTQAGLVPLALDVDVSDTARQHSAVEAQHRYVYHDGPDGTARSRDVAACGIGWYGENTGKVWSGGVDVLHREFMAEPWEPINHRTNIMDPNFRRAGIGAVQGPDAIYITMVFCR